jgi:hypothetical protein
MAQLSADEIAELGCTYAALILHDDHVAINVSFEKPSSFVLLNLHFRERRSSFFSMPLM